MDNKALLAISAGAVGLYLLTRKKKTPVIPDDDLVPNGSVSWSDADENGYSGYSGPTNNNLIFLVGSGYGYKGKFYVRNNTRDIDGNLVPYTFMCSVSILSKGGQLIYDNKGYFGSVNRIFSPVPIMVDLGPGELREVEFQFDTLNRALDGSSASQLYFTAFIYTTDGNWSIGNSDTLTVPVYEGISIQVLNLPSWATKYTALWTSSADPLMYHTDTIGYRNKNQPFYIGNHIPESLPINLSSFSLLIYCKDDTGLIRESYEFPNLHISGAPGYEYEGIGDLGDFGVVDMRSVTRIESFHGGFSVPTPEQIRRSDVDGNWMINENDIAILTDAVLKIAFGTPLSSVFTVNIDCPYAHRQFFDFSAGKFSVTSII